MCLTILTTLLIQSSSLMQLSWPVDGHVTSNFGQRWGHQHKGIDIGATKGMWVRSAADGMVIFAGNNNGYGNLVIVQHKNNVKTYYAHLENFCTFRYQYIKRGQRVGRVGSTGKSTGPHLHFEVRVRDKAIDPLDLLPAQILDMTYDQQIIGGL